MTAILRKYARGRVDPSYRDERGNTLAHLAALAGEPGTFPGANSYNTCGQTPRSLRDYLAPPPYTGTVPIFRRKTGRFETISPAAYAAQFNTEYLDRLQFRSPKILEWVMEKAMLRLGRPGIETQNEWLLSMYGEALLARKIPPVLIRYINPAIGYGVFAKSDLPQNAFIGEYTGIVERRKLFGDPKNHYVFGYMVGPFDTPYVINAEKRGNFTRFINHSDTPNLNSRWLILNGIGHIFFFANRRIEQGEQLTYDYGPIYWKRRPQPLDLN